MGEILGTGHYGIVRRGQWNHLSVAVKTLRSERSMKDLIAEINAMHDLSHPYLIRLYGIVLSDRLMMVIFFRISHRFFISIQQQQKGH